MNKRLHTTIALWRRVIPAMLLLFGMAVCAADGSAGSGDDEPRLTVITQSGTLVFRTSELLARDDLQAFTFIDISAYPREEVTFTAVKLGTLLSEVRTAPDAMLEVISSDGFVSVIAPERLLNTDPAQSVAWLAIEDPAAPWRAHRSGDGTAGPYYVFWVNPGLSDIGREEWPFKIDRIVERDSLRALYPGIFPVSAVDEQGEVMQGLRLFVKNCFTCHTINRVGRSQMGPDLNYPMSPLEYFQPGIVRQLIRNPQMVRHNPKSPMGNGFPPALLSDADVDAILAYLQLMADERNAQEKEQ